MENQKHWWNTPEGIEWLSAQAEIEQMFLVSQQERAALTQGQEGRMTTNKPEVIYLINTGDGVVWCDDRDPTGYGECDDAVKYVRGDAYEALQAECEKLRKDAERYRCLSSMATQQADALGPIFRIDVRRTPQALFNFDAAVDQARRVEEDGRNQTTS